jgi:hypothetical protein
MAGIVNVVITRIMQIAATDRRASTMGIDEWIIATNGPVILVYYSLFYIY